ncbi:hypothetical protein AB0G15_05750 [Streptosporangium sp. NPDC023825]|uniref:hypothetical protein n=1 Tax=Streptosporangium sp. NPDC023825 TaxID=3154909 RepID=UPI00341FB51C
MKVPKIIDLVFQRRDYTDKEQEAIGRFVAEQLELAEIVREHVRQNPVPYTLSEHTEQQYRMRGPSPEVTFYQVVPLPGNARVGQVQQDDDGKWLGYHFTKAPGRLNGGRLGLGSKPRDTKEEAVVDVIAEHLQYSGAVRFVESTD